ncbi:oxygenase MpaB family protein [Actinocorallia libanotica]|uniref:Oxygenase MpaB family protein n=1 Tax=Actinocorallia libanotica TaxID=46162 RepID=A0ABP4CBL7_9ACTN
MNLRAMIDESYWSLLAATHLPGEQYTEPVGDPGLFGPGSALWYVHTDVTGVLGGVSGLLLGTLNEPVTHGTNQHSNYLQDPIRRLGFTASFIRGMSFASTPVAEKLAEIVRKMHTRVHGTMPDGRPYSATESADIIWTGTTQAYQAARAHLRYHPRPLKGKGIDEYFAQYAVISEKLGATDVPKSRADVEDYFAMMRPRLTVSEETLEAIGFLRGPYGEDRVSQVTTQLVSRVATDLLPGWAKRLLGLHARTPLTPLAARAAGEAITRTLRHGVHQRYVEQAHQRVGVPFVPPSSL